MTNIIIEEYRCSPERNPVAELSLPLTFFDIPWLFRHAIQRLLFFKFPLSNPNPSFIEEIIPKLKTSLSLALNHYLPLAGNLVYHYLQDDSDNLFFRYVAGDYVSLTFVESSENFNNLAGNQLRKSDDFYQFVPELPPYVTTTSSKIIPLFAVQVTLFPNSGIAIGCTNHHVIGDANAIMRFIKAWASINKLDGQGDSHLLASDLLPFYDRSIIKDPNNFKAKKFNHMNSKRGLSFTSSIIIPTNKIRATFVLNQFDIQKLKSYVSKNRPELNHVSSFTVTCGYIWTCWLKAKDAVLVGETAAVASTDKEAEVFMFAIDCRSRLDPPIPAAYFGNCITATYATLSHEELVKKDGFVVASEVIGAAIEKMMNDKEALLSPFSKFSLDAVNIQRSLTVSGTSKYDIYEADFGWGRPEKCETISIDRDGAISLNKSAREESGGLEIGLSMQENKMEAFASIFTTGLKNL